MPAVETESVQLVLFDVQPVQTYVVGLFEQLALIVIVVPVCGAPLLAESEHTGVAADERQFTETNVAAPTPVALAAVSEYVCVPAVADVAEHCTPEQVTPVQA